MKNRLSATGPIPIKKKNSMIKIKKIIFFLTTPFNRRDSERFGIDFLLNKGFEVELWDITEALFPKVGRSYKPPDIIVRPGQRSFNNKKDLIRAIGTLTSETFVIPLHHYNAMTYPIYRAISASGARYASVMAGTNPGPEYKNRFEKFLMNVGKLRKEPVKKIIDHYFRKIPPRWLGVKPIGLVFASGNKMAGLACPADNTTEVLHGHDSDYDIYIRERAKKVVKRPIAVFLDQYLPFHPEYIYTGVKPPVSAARYYPLMNDFFRLVEDNLGLEVEIAAHPYSRYEEHADYFGGRKCHRGETIRLVRESSLVLAHHSRSLIFANLFKKPVMFLTSSELARGYHGPYGRAMAGCFGKKMIFMDRPQGINWEKEMSISESHYTNYRREFIKSVDSEDLPFWQLVSDRLKKGF